MTEKKQSNMIFKLKQAFPGDGVLQTHDTVEENIPFFFVLK